MVVIICFTFTTFLKVIKGQGSVRLPLNAFLVASHSKYGSICYRFATIRRPLGPPMVINSHVLVLVPNDLLLSLSYLQ